MAQREKLYLTKDLPGCPKGRMFLENIYGDFFHSMTDDEAIEGKLKAYFFTKQEVLDNPTWFSENKQ